MSMVVPKTCLKVKLTDMRRRAQSLGRKMQYIMMIPSVLEISYQPLSHMTLSVLIVHTWRPK